MVCVRILIIVLAAGTWGACGKTRPPDSDGDGDSDVDSDADSDGDACADQDHDGWGIGIDCAGNDCDETDPRVHDGCGENCGAEPKIGCPCEDNQGPFACFNADPDVVGHGACAAGLRHCRDGEWGGCEGQILPQPETCDGDDDDCDGEADNGVTNECGTCDAQCSQACIGGEGERCENFDLNAGGDNVIEAEGGGVTLGGELRSLHLIWLANSNEGTVSKVDTDTRQEMGRYRTGSNGAEDNPSRTSVDFEGDVVIGNRAFSTTASATKILAAGCPDQNGDGVVETSDGRDNVLPWGEDECVVWNTEFEGAGNNEWESGAVARAVAVQDRVGLDGTIVRAAWIGLYNNQQYVELDRDTGEPTGIEVDVSPVTPYGAAIDRDGNLWSAGLSSSIARFDTASPDAGVDVFTNPGGSNYGITVDDQGIVWTGGTLSRFDPSDETWQTFGNYWGTGIAADGNGSVWLGASGGGAVYRVRTDSLEVTTIQTGSSPYGVAVDFQGYVWGIGISHGNAAIIDPETEEVELVLNDCEGGGNFNGGTGCLDYPYTYSDMTGFQLANATDPLGKYSHVIQGCDIEGADTTWSEMTIEAEVPVGSQIAIAVRTADDPALLPNAELVNIGSIPPDEGPWHVGDALEAAGVEPGRYLQLIVSLISIDRSTKPILRSFAVNWSCGNIFG